MVVERFIPRKLTNGIIKHIYKTEEDIHIDVSSITTGYTSIYKTSIFEDDSTSLESYITLTFKKYIFISYFALRPRIWDSKHWCPPKNVSLRSCFDGICTTNHIESSSSKYESTRMILTPVIPSVSNLLNFTISGVNSCASGANFHTIGRLEIFGFACDKREECNGKLMNIINTCKMNSSTNTITTFLITLSISK